MWDDNGIEPFVWEYEDKETGDCLRIEEANGAILVDKISMTNESSVSIPCEDVPLFVSKILYAMEQDSSSFDERIPHIRSSLSVIAGENAKAKRDRNRPSQKAIDSVVRYTADKNTEYKPVAARVAQDLIEAGWTPPKEDE